MFALLSPQGGIAQRIPPIHGCRPAQCAEPVAPPVPSSLRFTGLTVLARSPSACQMSGELDLPPNHRPNPMTVHDRNISASIDSVKLDRLAEVAIKVGLQLK